MRRTNLYLADEQCEVLDRIAAEDGVSRAEVVRRLIDASVRSGGPDAESDLRALDASFGVWRDSDSKADRHTNERQQRGPDARSGHLDALRNV